ncbi:MAG: hypothetical protein IKU97_07710 [Tidjanibacter sp.]|nr:hypothetical protein [Tidjanibacter sp.]
MKFTLIHYTEGWDTGACVELSAFPPLGTLVKASNEESFEDIYYVDNILLADGGENYLFVRPYEGYGRMAPLTELDRTTEAVAEGLKEVTKAVDFATDVISGHLICIR